jgi:cytochrome P450
VIELSLPERVDKPAHVPDDLVFDFDIYKFPVHNGEFQLALLKLREQNVPPVFWTPRNGGHWIATRTPDIRKVVTDSAVFSSRHSSVPKELAPDPPLPPMQSDPPAHGQFRSLLAGALSPPAVRALESDIRSLSIELIEGLAPRGECDFIGDFARHMPIAIFMSIVDLPRTDRAELLRITETCMRPEKPEDRVAGFAMLGAYSLQKVRERRANPGTDLISEITRAKIDNNPLTDETIGNVVTLLLTAGLDTVVAMLGFFARFLARSPKHRQQLIQDPSRITAAVEELLRRHAIISMARELTCDIELRGVHLKRGDMISVPSVLANLDEGAFDDPLNVDFNRKTIPHMTFGGGPHRCLGALLARTELRIFLEEWLPRIPDFDIRPDFEVQVRCRVVTTIPELPLVWTPRTRAA